MPRALPTLHNAEAVEWPGEDEMRKLLPAGSVLTFDVADEDREALENEVRYICADFLRVRRQEEMRLNRRVSNQALLPLAKLAETAVSAEDQRTAKRSKSAAWGVFECLAPDAAFAVRLAMGPEFEFGQTEDQFVEGADFKRLRRVALEVLDKTPGPIQDHTLDRTVEALVGVFERATGTSATHSNHSRGHYGEGAPQSKAGQFIAAIMKRIEPALTGARLSRSMARAVQRLGSI